MPHPSLGLPPADTTAGHPAAAARVRREGARLGRLALEASAQRDPTFATRYDEIDLRRFLRDFERHIEQVARALETGEDYFVVNYGEWLVPVYRRRRVPMRDFALMLMGLRDAAASVLSPEEVRSLTDLIDRWQVRLKHHGRLAGDHKGIPIVRFFWKGAGIADDSII
jgi:hypothetical protein